MITDTTDLRVRIERLEQTLGTLVSWLHGTLSSDECTKLYLLLHPPVAPTKMSEEQKAAAAKAILDNDYSDMERLKAPPTEPRWMGPAEYTARFEAHDLPPEGTYYTGERREATTPVVEPDRGWHGRPREADFADPDSFENEALAREHRIAVDERAITEAVADSNYVCGAAHCDDPACGMHATPVVERAKEDV